MDIVVWLRSLGLGKYEAAFRENEIDETGLPSLTHETLKELGVTALGTTSGAFVYQNEGDRKAIARPSFVAIA
jgi:hypothetical protein